MDQNHEVDDSNGNAINRLIAKVWTIFRRDRRCLCGCLSESNVHAINIENDSTKKKALALFDTGSEKDLISSKFLRQLGKEPIQDVEKPTIFGIGGGSCRTGGYVDLEWHGLCRMKSKRYDARFWVCTDEVDFEVLVGHETLVRQGAIKIKSYTAVMKKQSKEASATEGREERRRQHEKERDLNREKVSENERAERRRVVG